MLRAKMESIILLITLTAAISVAVIPLAGESVPACPDNEKWFHCGACDATCNAPQIACPAVCRIPGSCGCVEGHVRESKQNRCIPVNECAKAEPDSKQTPPCPEKEIWAECGACDGTCSLKKPMCPKLCREGSCACVKDHVREPNGGSCIHIKECANIDPIIQAIVA